MIILETGVLSHTDSIAEPWTVSVTAGDDPSPLNHHNNAFPYRTQGNSHVTF